MKSPLLNRKERKRLLIVLALAAAACIILLLIPPGSRNARFLPKCVFHEVTGLHCPGCGATRALAALLHGDIKASLHNNLLLIPGALMACLLLVKQEMRYPKIAGYIALALMAAFTILRNIPCEPFTLLAPISTKVAAASANPAAQDDPADQDIPAESESSNKENAADDPTVSDDPADQDIPAESDGPKPATDPVP